MDNCSNTDNSVGAGTGQQLHDGRVHSYSAGSRSSHDIAAPDQWPWRLTRPYLAVHLKRLP